MATTLFIVLIISQLLTFYFLIVLNVKLSKYKAIEEKQENIIREMDDSIAAYLMELRDENDRLIERLTKVSGKPKSHEANQTQTESEQASYNSSYQASSKPVMEAIEETQTPLTQPQAEEKASVVEIAKIIPKSFAQNAYKKQANVAKEPVQTESVRKEQPADQVLEAFEQQVVNLHRAGMTVDEIAKKTQKGKTEIELLIKFHA